MPTKRLIHLSCLLVFTALTAWLVVRSLPSRGVHLASASEMKALEPAFNLSMARLPESRVDRAIVSRALQDAESSGEKCDFWFASACPATGRIMYVLNVLAVSDTQLIYAGHLDGASLVSKAYWSGFSGWKDRP